MRPNPVAPPLPDHVELDDHELQVLTRYERTAERLADFAKEAGNLEAKGRELGALRDEHRETQARLLELSAKCQEAAAAKGRLERIARDERELLARRGLARNPYAVRAPEEPDGAIGSKVSDPPAGAPKKKHQSRGKRPAAPGPEVAK